MPMNLSNPKQQHPQKGQTPKICQALSEIKGALSYDEFGTACWSVYGKAVNLSVLTHSLMEGFQITNFNFNATKKAVVSKPKDLPGQTGEGGGGMLA
jgi:hypothetical protein